MYTVALLIEHGLQTLDADQVASLTEELDDQIVYHLLMAVDEGAALLAGSLGAVGGAPAPTVDPDVVTLVDDELQRRAEGELAESADLLRTRGGEVHVHLTETDPVDALTSLVSSVSADEVVVLTEPHTVKSFFHVDWASRAERALDVPTLHLLEHVPFEAQR